MATSAEHRSTFAARHRQWSKADLARAALFEIFWGSLFVYFDYITRIYSIRAIIHVQCLQYVLCSLLSLQNILGYV